METISYSLANHKVIERLIDNKDVAINHMILPEGEGLPLHVSNAPVYMVVVRGIVSLILNDVPKVEKASGSILLIPMGTTMNVQNEQAETLELFVIKAPGPASFT